MLLARIGLIEGEAVWFRRTIGVVVYEAMVSALGAPKDDRFQLLTEHPAADLILDPIYLGIERTPDCAVIQLALNGGRMVEQKQAFYKQVADRLHERLGLREDVSINVIEVVKEKWSYGNGVAQYA